MTPPKEHINFPLIILKEMEISELPEKELNIIGLRKLSGYKGMQIDNKVRNRIHEQNAKFSRDRSHNKDQTEILELKNTMTEMKNVIVSTIDLMEQKKESMNSKDKAFESIQSEYKNKK